MPYASKEKQREYDKKRQARKTQASIDRIKAETGITLTPETLRAYTTAQNAKKRTVYAQERERERLRQAQMAPFETQGYHLIDLESPLMKASIADIKRVATFVYWLHRGDEVPTSPYLPDYRSSTYRFSKQPQLSNEAFMLAMGRRGAYQKTPDDFARPKDQGDRKVLGEEYGNVARVYVTLRSQNNTHLLQALDICAPGMWTMDRPRWAAWLRLVYSVYLSNAVNTLNEEMAAKDPVFFENPAYSVVAASPWRLMNFEGAYDLEKPGFGLEPAIYNPVYDLKLLDNYPDSPEQQGDILCKNALFLATLLFDPSKREAANGAMLRLMSQEWTAKPTPKEDHICLPSGARISQVFAAIAKWHPTRRRARFSTMFVPSSEKGTH